MAVMMIIITATIFETQNYITSSKLCVCRPIVFDLYTFLHVLGAFSCLVFGLLAYMLASTTVSTVFSYVRTGNTNYYGQ